ncbi:MAG: bifunctional riboflavin kinase/FAD synthetase [Candidatus Omnitrophica bacterium]|nr:bifunctional riboflavin kinase/FAD synthetase [Candidatus Omnitrophota bacterium]
MILIRGLRKLRKFGNPVVALGVFDGVHLGHINILKSAVAMARSIKGQSMVITFDPHPQKEPSLYSLEHRLRLFKQLGIDAAIVINFSKVFSAISAQSFLKDILCAKIGARYIYVGKNFRFGKRAKGDLKLLRDLRKACGYKLKAFDVIRVSNKPVSSTFIRRLIKIGDLVHASKLLTRQVSILGTVIPGNSLGRLIGFPTANINPHHEVIPPSGIYAVRVLVEGRAKSGICYIGTRPTLESSLGKSVNPKVHVEVHIFDFKNDIYNKYLEIRFIKKIREDRKFRTIKSLTAQIQIDAAAAKKILRLH